MQQLKGVNVDEFRRLLKDPAAEERKGDRVGCEFERGL
jgi:hypothetical protein